jgi:hypothetical protein
MLRSRLGPVAAALLLIASAECFARTAAQVQAPVAIPVGSMTEVSTALIGQNKNVSCPDGAAFFADTNQIVKTDLSGGGSTVVWLRSSAPQIQQKPVNPYVIDDEQIVSTYNGTLVYSVEAVTWQPLTPAPSWSQATVKYQLKYQNQPMGRGVIYIWTSRDCGASWQFQPPVDFGSLLVWDASQAGDWTKTSPIAGLCGIPRVHSDGSGSEAGGADGHVLYADRNSTDIYISTSCSHGYTTQQFAPDGTEIGTIPSSYPDIHLLLKSSDDGATWQVVAESANGTWRANMSSSPTNLYLILGNQTVYALPRPVPAPLNLDSLPIAVAPQGGQTGALPKTDPTNTGALYFTAGSASLAALTDGNVSVSTPGWCGGDRLVWYVDTWLSPRRAGANKWLSIATTWPPSQNGSPSNACPPPASLPTSQDYFATLVEPPYGSGAPPLWVWLNRSNIGHVNRVPTPTYGTFSILAGTPNDGEAGLNALPPASSSWTWDGSSFFGDYFTGGAVHAGDSVKYIFSWPQNGALYMGSAIFGPLGDTSDTIFAFSSVDDSGRMFHVSGDGDVLTDGQAPAHSLSSWTQILGLGDKSRLFFFNANDGSGAVAHVAGQVLVTDGQQGAGTFARWTNITALQDNKLFFYNAADGSGAVGHATDAGAIQTDGQQGPGAFGTWTHTVGLGDGRLFVYNAGDGSAAVGHLTGSGSIATDFTFAPGSFGAWTHIVSTGNGQLLFFDGKFGAAALAHVTGSAVVTDRQYGANSFLGWTNLVGFSDGRVLMYNQITGDGSVLQVTPGNRALQPAGHVNFGAWSLLAAY